MFKKKPKERTALELAIDDLIEKMMLSEAGSAEHSAIAKDVEVLQKAKSHEKDKSINPDVALTVGGNLAGILAILSFEKFNVVTSKAIGFVLKAKL